MPIISIFMRLMKSNLPFLAWIPALQKKGPVVWLDSADEGEHGGRFSFLAGDPAHIFIRKSDEQGRFGPADLWKEWQEAVTSEPAWWFGFFSYDCKNIGEETVSKGKNVTSLPDIWFIQPRFLARFDHLSGQLELLIGEIPLEESHSTEGWSLTEPASRLQPEDYFKRIAIIKSLIREGDHYELNLTYALTGMFSGSALEAYQFGRVLTRAPHSAFISGDSFDVLSFSPERFLQKSGNRLLSEPIKGTRPNSGLNGEEMIRELSQSEKERAEHVMIVDLVRHDLARVSETGSVKVRKPFEIRSFETVHQMVSSISATVRPETGIGEILKACFPMGSMTGAPKTRVMQRIEELESWRRGLYSGAIGYVSPAGDFDFNVVIRTLVIQNGKYSYGVGGAITSDSTAEEEWAETKTKSRILERLAEQSRRNDTK